MWAEYARVGGVLEKDAIGLEAQDGNVVISTKQMASKVLRCGSVAPDEVAGAAQLWRSAGS